MLNDRVGPHPVLVYVDGRTQAIGVFLRRLGELTLTFALRDGSLVDQETGSARRNCYPQTTWYPEKR